MIRLSISISTSGSLWAKGQAPVHGLVIAGLRHGIDLLFYFRPFFLFSSFLVPLGGSGQEQGLETRLRTLPTGTRDTDPTVALVG